MKTLQRRLEALEQQHGDNGGYEIWLGTGEGDDLIGPNDEILSAAEFEARSPNAIDIGGPLLGVESGTHEEH